ncbi:MAG: efflux RND transporter permease subunit [Spirochaetales bacterium]|nr:efflux RND transporter permease subunit [Spirochaetales bacterium]
MTIGKFSVSNSVLINSLMVAILIFGFISVSRLPQEQFSEVPFFWVNIIVPYPGVAVEDVERTVTVKIENEYQGISKLKRIRSVTNEGLSVVRIEFDDGISKEEFARLYQEVQTRFNKISLPEGIPDAIIDDFSAADFLPVIEVVLVSNSNYSSLNKTALLLRDRLLTAGEVAGIAIVGSRDRQLVIKANKEKCENLRITTDEIIRAIQSRNLNIPGGFVETSNREYILRTVGDIENIDDFKKIIIRQNNSGSAGTIYLEDIAVIREDFDPRGIRARFNGYEAITLRISKVTGGSSTRVIQRVKDEIKAFNEIKPDDIWITLFSDSTIQITDSINILLSNALIGFILVLLILFLFIGFRNAIITAIGIPVTFAITFLILEALGETFNTNTLFGLVLVLGLIVDDAIVIVENCYRLYREGLSRKEAAIQGTNQVIVPVIASTLTTVAAFFPLMILPGTIGKFLRVIPLTVTIALLASTFEASLFLPSHFADWPGKSKIKKSESRWFENFQKWFTGIISRIYKFKLPVVIGLILIIIIAFAIVPLIQQDLFSAEDFSLFYINIQLPLGSNRQKTNAVVSEFEKRILPLINNGEIAAVNSYIGFTSGTNQNTAKSNIAQITVDLTERNQGRTRPISRIMSETRELCADISGVEKIEYRKATNGPPVSSPVSFRLFGDSYDDLILVSGGIQEKLLTYPDLLNIKDDVEQGSKELLIRVNEEQAARFGLTVASIGRALRASFEGIKASTFFKNNEEIDIIVTYDIPETTDISLIEQMTFITPDGRGIPFSAVCTLTRGVGYAAIKREDGKREITIESGAYSKKNIRKINSEIVNFFNETYKQQYPDIVLKVGGEFAEFGDLLIQILRIFLIGIFLIYLILGTQFKSYSQPFLILFSVPFAFVGVIFFLIISGTPFSTTVLYSGVALAGIAVNDAIVLISFINDKRKQGSLIKDAIIESVETRLRPILLTSITTIAGLIPTAIGIGGTSVVWGPMASTIIFGLIFSTLSSLVFIPCFYGLLYDRRKKEAIE